MNTPLPASSRLIARAVAVAVLGSVLSLAVSRAAPAPATEQPALQPVADKIARLPVTFTAKKETEGENKGLFTVTLKNASESALKITATVHESVISHNRPKVRELPPVTLEPGKTSKIEALAAHDKVVLVAAGFGPMEIVVP
ncbi:MAG TPA: hypothetical protein VHO24_07445 [Opitutaceae bacterium]|nr:hypothetical protein [Opitutaceae bacterium]